jgi:hypothetical protein
MTRVRPTLSMVAVVVSCLALVAALAGTAYAITITGKDIKDGTVTGTDVKDQSLKGGDLLVRVTSAQDANNTVTGASTGRKALEATITAPVNGFLAITASSDVRNTEESAFAGCSLSIDITTIRSSARLIDLNQTELVNTEENCATNATVPVRKGKHIVRLWVTTTSSDTVFDATTLQAIFIPFGPTGHAPTRFGITKGAGIAKLGNR